MEMKTKVNFIANCLLVILLWNFGAVRLNSQIADQSVSLRTAEKLKETILATFEVRGGTLLEILEYSRAKYISLNSDNPDFNVVFQKPEIPPFVLPGDTAPSDPLNAQITLSLSAIPMIELFKYVAGLSDTKFRIVGETVIFAQASDKTAFLKYYTVNDWKVEAMRLYPDLEDPESRMYKAVSEEADSRRENQAALFKDDSWPLQIATIVAERIGCEPQLGAESRNKLEYSPPPSEKPVAADADASVKKPSEVAKNAMPAVFTIIVMNSEGRPISLGSGFLVREDCVATNHHVISVPYASSIMIEGGGLTEPVKVSRIPLVDDEVDLALLRVSRPIGKPLLMGKSGEVGDPVFVIGSPRGLRGTFSTGVISGYRKVGEFARMQISAPISSGSSGGPVLDGQGNVIGVSIM